jgi:hypothetical protein
MEQNAVGPAGYSAKPGWRLRDIECYPNLRLVISTLRLREWLRWVKQNFHPCESRDLTRQPTICEIPAHRPLLIAGQRDAGLRQPGEKNGRVNPANTGGVGRRWPQNCL